MSRAGKRPRLDQELEIDAEAWYDPYANPPCDDNDWAVMPPPESCEDTYWTPPPGPSFSKSEIATFEEIRIRAKLSEMVSALDGNKIQELLVGAMMSSPEIQAAVSAAYIEKMTKDIAAKRVERAQAALQRDSMDNPQQEIRQQPQQQAQRGARQRGSRRRRGRGHRQAH